ncbi:hypothetical protein GQ53DRAFT_822455 [Thozetella sp. PMI_491]|nr:hypothetical protein GQ53DRAFT_822455 [Thozetella sp. PMI_491]
MAWQNLHSFLARRIPSDPYPIHGLWQIREALEKPLARYDEAAKNSFLWIASEWMIHTSDALLDWMRSDKNIDEESTRSFQTYPLCDAPSQSFERWEFWKKQFSYYGTGTSDYMPSDATKMRLEAAAKSMEAAEARYKPS